VTIEEEIAKLRREVAVKQKRENDATDRAKRAEEHIASLRLENENLRALVLHLGCRSCLVGEIALTIHRMLFEDKEHSHSNGRGGRTVILHEDKAVRL
jgi:hypothetical protein